MTRPTVTLVTLRAGLMAKSVTRLPGRQKSPDEPICGHLADIVRDAIEARINLDTLQALYRWALSRGYAHANPTTALELPKGGRKRDRVVSTAMAGELVAALASRDQAC